MSLEYDTCTDTLDTLYLLCLFLYECPYSTYVLFFFQAEDGIRDLVRSRGLGDVYKRQARSPRALRRTRRSAAPRLRAGLAVLRPIARCPCCLLYTSDAADERSSVDLGGRRIIKKNKRRSLSSARTVDHKHRLRAQQSTAANTPLTLVRENAKPR